MRVYQIFVDRFSTGSNNKDYKLRYKTSKNRLGGNISGIINKLDYIHSLGFDAIWLTPIFKADSYHGYGVLDHFSIDPHMGNDHDLSNLVNKAHKLGIRVILDFVANHVSYKNEIFREASIDKNSEYRDWFTFYKNNDYLSFLNFKSLPKINLENSGARNYMLNAASYWIDKFDIDGYRLDHAIGPSKGFWIEFISVCRNMKSDFIFLPEIWFSGVDDSSMETIKFFDERDLKYINSLKLKGEYSDVWNNYFNNYIQHYALEQGFKLFGSVLDFEYNFNIRKQVIDKSPFIKQDHKKSYFAFLDNHDMQRIAWIANTEERLLHSLSVLFNADDLVLYYGTEIGMTQMHDFTYYKSYADIEARRFMNWKHTKYEEEILEYTRSLAKD